MEYVKTIKRSKEDYKALESYLEGNNLLGQGRLWFAGYDDSARASRNSVLANLLYGKKKLMVLSVSSDTLYILKNSRDGFRVHTFGGLEDGYEVHVRKGFLWPSIAIESKDETLNIKVVKNKKMVRELKKLLK